MTGQVMTNVTQRQQERYEFIGAARVSSSRADLGVSPSPTKLVMMSSNQIGRAIRDVERSQLTSDWGSRFSNQRARDHSTCARVAAQRSERTNGRVEHMTLCSAKYLVPRCTRTAK